MDERIGHVVRRLRRDQASLAVLLPRAQRIAERSEYLLQLLEDYYDRLPGHGPSLASAREMRGLADAGVRHLELGRQPDGTHRVRVDGGEAFGLSPRRFQLLWVAALGAGAGEDGFPPWRTHDQVAMLMSELAGRRVRPRSLNQTVARLRECLRENRVNPFLLQNRPGLGMRFLTRELALDGLEPPRADVVAG